MNETKELDKIEPKKAVLKIYGKDREIFFGFSTWKKIERELGGLKNLSKLQERIENEPFEVIPHLLFLGLVDKSPFERNGKMVEITEENILDEYGLNDIQMITEVFQTALNGSMPVGESKKEVEAVKAE